MSGRTFESDDRAVLFLTALRRETARTLLRALGTRLLVDAVPTLAQRSRAQRHRNGIGALLAVSSDVAWRPTPLVSLFYGTRAGAQARLRYGIGELGSALAPPAVMKRHRAVVVTTPIVAALVAGAAIAKRRRTEPIAQPASPDADEARVVAAA
jgi:hypothetical protein